MSALSLFLPVYACRIMTPAHVRATAAAEPPSLLTAVFSSQIIQLDEHLVMNRRGSGLDDVACGKLHAYETYYGLDGGTEELYACFSLNTQFALCSGVSLETQSRALGRAD